VKEVLDRHPEWEGDTYVKNKILYACLAVSVAATQPAVAAVGAAAQEVV
jgi:hypothetical protein